MAIYLKFGNLKGNATAEGYTGQIVLDTVDFGVSRKVSMETGNLTNRESSKPNWSQVSVSKKADNSIAALLREAAVGAAGQEATITFVRTGDKVQDFMAYKLSNCIVSDYRISAAGDEEPREYFSLSYSAIEVSYKDHDASNKSGNPQRFSYDIKAAKSG